MRFHVTGAELFVFIEKEGFNLRFDKELILKAAYKNRMFLIPGFFSAIGFTLAFYFLSLCEGVSSFDYFGLILLAYFVYLYIFVAHKFLILNKIFFWLVPVVNFFILESFMHDPFLHIQILTMGLNIVFYYLVFFSFLFLFRNKGIAVSLFSVLAFGIGLANYAVIAFRQNPILPWDLLSVGTAVKVVGNYRLPITTDLIMLCGWFLFLLVFGFFMLNHRVTYRKSVMVVASIGLVCMFLLSCFTAQLPTLGKYFRISDSLFTPSTYFMNNGYVLGFVRSLPYIDVDKPSGYSAEESEDLLDSYSTVFEGASDEKPNIIVVMNEAFSDLSVLGDFSTNEAYLPRWNALSDNTIKGNLHVSVKGGNTANTEFEFLTGHSMAFLPAGSVPYQLYIKEETPSLAWHLKENFNYATYSVHPYEADAWKRNEIYPLLGFDHMLFVEDFSADAEKIRNFTSDAATYDKIIDLYEERDPNKGFFTFCVTLQNHGGYEYLFDNFTPTVRVDGLENAFPLNHYLSLIKASDEAFYEFVRYFEQVDEPTVILMFGDHQPTDEMIRELLEQVDLDPSKLEDIEKQYITPFAIWANYDIQEDYIENVSCNYLSSILLESADIPLSSYQKYLLELQVKYPVVTANCAIDQSGDYFTPEAFYDHDNLIQYSKLQYFKLFD